MAHIHFDWVVEGEPFDASCKFSDLLVRRNIYIITFFDRCDGNDFLKYFIGLANYNRLRILFSRGEDTVGVGPREGNRGLVGVNF